MTIQEFYFQQLNQTLLSQRSAAEPANEPGRLNQAVSTAIDICNVRTIRHRFDKKPAYSATQLGRVAVSVEPWRGAGVLALAHAEFHNSGEAKESGEWLLKHSFTEYNGNNGFRYDRYHYSLFNACHSMYQLGNPYWAEFFPPTVRALLASQQASGSWETESLQRDRPFGNSYTMAMVVLPLGARNQILPVFQG